MPLPVITASIIGLLIVAALSQPLAARLRLPLAAVLAGIGLTISIFARWAETAVFEGNWTIVGDSAQAFMQIPISSDIFLYLLLPVLLFQGAVGIDVRHLARDSAAVLLLAILAVLTSIAIIGGAVHLVSGLSLTACLLLGAIVATTDPSAVIAIFRELGAPARLTRLVEGESLLNDASAIAAFTILLSALISGAQPSLPDLGIQLISGFGAGAILGVAGGILLARTLDRLGSFRSAQMTLTLVTPYVLFLIGSTTPLISGVVAVVAGGISLGFIGRSRFDRSDFKFLRELLDQASDWSTGLIFLLAALLVPELLSDITLRDVLLIGLVILSALSARAIILWGVAPLLASLKLMKPIDNRMNTALLWGGLRGAMTLALVLAVSETPGLDPETRHMIAVVATGYTLFTLLVQGTTLRVIIRALGLTNLTPVEKAFRSQALSSTVRRTHERVRAFARRAGLSESLVAGVMKPYEERLSKADLSTAFEEEVSDIEKLRLGMDALVSQERNLLLEQRWSSGLPSSMVDQYLYVLDRMRDEARSSGRVGYLRTARSPYRATFEFRFATQLHNVTGRQSLLASYIGRRFHYLLVNRVMVMQLQWYADSKLKPIFESRMTDILLEILSRRKEEIEGRIDTIRLQYPDFACALEESMVARYAHHEEVAQIRDLQAAGIIAPGIAASLSEEAKDIHRQLRRPGRVDIEQPKPDLLRTLRAFETFSDRQLKQAARKMKSVIFPSNTLIYKSGDRMDYIYFIANGAVEVDRVGEDEKIKLGRGQAFGQLRVLNPDMKPATVRTLTYSHCFRMKISDFRKLMREAPTWKSDMASSSIAALPPKATR